MLEPLNFDMEDMDDAGAGDAGFGEYYRSLDAALHMNMETPDSFLDAVPLKTPEMREHMHELVHLGQLLRDCPAGNRYEKLEMLRRERGRWQELVEAFDNEDDPEKFSLVPYTLDGQEIMDKVGVLLLGIMPEYIAGPEDLVFAKQRIIQAGGEVRETEKQIRVDITDNVFHDFGMLKRLYMFNDRDRKYNGLKYHWETDFTKRAIGRGCVMMSDTRRLNSQAHHAKLMETVDLTSARATRSLQGRGRSMQGNTTPEELM